MKPNTYHFAPGEHDTVRTAALNHWIQGAEKRSRGVYIYNLTPSYPHALRVKRFRTRSGIRQAQTLSGRWFTLSPSVSIEEK